LWQVDEAGEMELYDTPGLYLVQTDGRHDLENPDDWNQGDAGTLSGNGQDELKDTGANSIVPEGPFRRHIAEYSRGPGSGAFLSTPVLSGSPNESKEENTRRGKRKKRR
jgi:hypothetical protein